MKTQKKKILIGTVILLATLFIGVKLYYTTHLTSDEQWLRQYSINLLNNALVAEVDFKVNSNGTVDYTIISRDDAQLNYNLYVYYQEYHDDPKSPVELKTAEELWAEVPLDTWHPAEGTYLSDYTIWAAVVRGRTLAVNWARIQESIDTYNRYLQSTGFSKVTQKDITTMTPEEIWNFTEKIEDFNTKWASGQPITEADLID